MTAHEELIRATLDHFLSTGGWPKVKGMQIRLRRLGNIAKLASEIGYDQFICEESTDGVCKLTLKGLAPLEEAEPDIHRFLHAIRKLAHRYIESETLESIPAVDLLSDLELSETEVRRVLELIDIAPGIYTGTSGSPMDATLTVRPSPHIWYFEDVQTIEEFHTIFARVGEDVREAERGRFAAFIPAESAEITSSEEAVRGPWIFVNPSRLDQLRAVEDPQFDLLRLITLCEELNICAANGCLFAVVMLTRAVVDHVPPIFNAQGFEEVVNNYSAAGKSFKDSMRHLHSSARKIADSHLHLRIRSRESLPTVTQVDFSRDLDVLLAEIVRVLS